LVLFFQQVSAVFWKDFKTEVRTKERLSAMCFFAFLVLLVFNFAFTPGSETIRNAAPGVFWIAVTFSGFMGLTRSFVSERDNDCLTGLLLSPADSGAIYLGKMLANLCAMLLVEALILPLMVVFLNIAVWQHLPRLLPGLLLGTLGFAAVGTLFAAMSLKTRLQEALLPMLTLPVLVPALLAAVESFRAVLAGDSLSDISAWINIGGAFALLFVAACVLLFDYVIEE
jgi:heme exporter protein B